MNILLVSSCALAFFVFGMSSSIVGPTIDDLSVTLGTSVVMIGLIRSGRQLGQFFGFLCFGRSADKYDLRLLAGIGALAMASGLSLIPLNSIIFALCASVVWGIGHSVYNLAPNVIIGRVYEKRAPGIMTMLHGVYGIGAMSGPWIVELFRGQGVETVYHVCAVLVIIAGGLYVVATKGLPQNTSAKKEVKATPFKPLKTQNLKPFFWGILLFSGANFAAADWLFYHTEKFTVASSIGATLVTSSFWFALTIGRFLLGYATQRAGEQLVIRGSVLVSIFGSIILIYPGASFYAVLIGSMALGVGLAAIYPILIASAANLHPENRGSVTGYLAGAGALGAIILPALQGLVTVAGSFGLVTILGSTVLMGLVLWNISLVGVPKKKGETL